MGSDAPQTALWGVFVFLAPPSTASLPVDCGGMGLTANQKYYAENQERERARALANYHANPAASKARRKKWKRENPTSASASLRKTSLKKYGISPEEYDRLLAEQGGVCAICRKPETVAEKGVVRRLNVDHCHKTNRVRGLLCSRCNILLGYAKDLVGLLRAAAEYLERFS